MSERYTIIPFDGSPHRAGIVSQIMRGICSNEAVLSDYTRACEERCFTCESCTRALSTASRILANPSSLRLEVWRNDDDVAVLVGIMIVLPVSASESHVHFCFFDGRLRDKRYLLERMIAWVFQEREGWQPPQRLTAEIPDYAFALARFCTRYLQFGGDFVYRRDGKSIHVEGVRRAAVRWRGSDRDVLVLGRLRNGN